MGEKIELAAADGFRLSAYRATPSGKARGGIVIVQEIFGVNSHIQHVCDGYANDGYLVIAPALFDRYQANVNFDYSADGIARGRELKTKASIDNALDDIAAARDAVAIAGKVGIIGYCWGGFVAWMAASRLDGFACAVPYYGGGMTEAIDQNPRCPLMAHFGQRDKSIPVAGVEKLRAAHPADQIFIYDAEHGFNCDRRESYDPAAATLARERTLEFLREHVG